MSLPLNRLLRVSRSSVRLYSKKTDIQITKVHQPTGTFGPLTTVTDEDRHYQLGSAVGGREGSEAPLVIIFGWAGATHKVLMRNTTNIWISL